MTLPPAFIAPLFYAVEASLTLALLYAVYWLLLRGTTFHRLNRFILLGVALVSLLLPLASRFVPGMAIFPAMSPDLANPATALITIHRDLAAGTVRSTGDPQNILPLSSLVTILYALGAAIFLYRVIAPLVTLAGLIRRNKKQHYAGYTLVALAQPSPPFSFFRWIFLPPGDYPESQREQILLHEQVHARQLHTLDILFMECLTAVFWFHPLAWRLNARAKLNLEYLADRELLRSGIPAKEYQYHLLQVGLARRVVRGANYFNRSQLKQRIAMMNKNNSRHAAQWKALFFLPAVIVLSFVFGSLRAQSPGVTKDAAKDSPAGTDIYLVIRPETTGPQLHSIETYLAADGIDIAFTQLSYTAAHQLSGLRMVIRQGQNTLEDITIAGTGEPLAEPLIFYWFRSRQGSLGLSRGYPGDLAAKDLDILHNLTGLLKRAPATQQFDLHGSARIGD